MPGLTYRGFAAKFADKRFARKVFAFNLFLFCSLSLFMIMTNKTEKVDTCETRHIDWEEFIQHTCENENLWILIDGNVYDMWPWG